MNKLGVEVLKGFVREAYRATKDVAPFGAEKVKKALLTVWDAVVGELKLLIRTLRAIWKLEVAAYKALLRGDTERAGTYVRRSVKIAALYTATHGDLRISPRSPVWHNLVDLGDIKLSLKENLERELEILEGGK